VISGEISIFYIPREDDTTSSTNLTKVIGSGQLACLFDLEDDMFEGERFLKMVLQCTTTSDEPTKYIYLTKEKLHEYFHSLGGTRPPLQSFFQFR
jgi:hypothetical protein